MTREQIAALVPGGVPDSEERARMVAVLVTMAGDNPEIDVEIADKALIGAARALFADMLLVNQLESAPTPSVTHVERVARALWKAETGGAEEETWGKYLTPYRQRARLVLETADGWNHDPVTARR